MIPDRHVTNRLALSDENSVGIRQQRTTIESEIHVGGVGHDVAEAILQRLAGERESNRHCVALDDGLNRRRRFLKNQLA